MLRNYLIMSLKVLGRRRFFTFISLFGISVTLAVLIVIAALYDHAAAPQGTEADLDRMLLLFRMTMSGREAQSDGSPGYGFLNTYARTCPAWNV